MKQTKSVLLAIMLIAETMSVYAYSVDQYQMKVGETKTFFLPSEVTSRASNMYSYSCYSDYINNVEVTNYDKTSITLTALSYMATTVHITYDYWWSENGTNKHDTYMINVTFGDDGSPGTQDENPYNYAIDRGCWGTVTIEEGQTRTFQNYFPDEIDVQDLDKIKSIVWSSYKQPGYTITSQDWDKCTIKGTTVSNNQKLWCLMKYGSSSYSAYYIINVKKSSKETLSLSATPSGGNVEKGTTVYLSASQTSSNIYYTLDGSKPTSRSTKYTSDGIIINGPCTLKAIAMKSGYNNSPIMTWEYTTIVEPTDIKFYPDILSILVGDSSNLKFELIPSDATTTITWSSEDPSIASINSKGLVKGLKEGLTTIWAETSNGEWGFCMIKVCRNFDWGDYFTSFINGVEMLFQVTSTYDNECCVRGGGENIYDVDSKNTAIDINTTGSISIPSETKGFNVTEIFPYAFKDCSELTSVNIPNSITDIMEYAFYGCSGLKSITIPNYITYIAKGAFRGCSGLTSVNIPNGVHSILDDAFSGCSGLTSITIPNSVTYIAYNAFSDCSGLTSVNIPYSVETIGMRAFSYCNSLSSLTISNGVESIRGSAFAHCNELKTVTIPSSVKSIDGNIFIKCSMLESINVSDGNKYYDSRGNCNAIIESATNKLISGCKNTIIPYGVTSIGTRAFEDCSNLSSVTIPNSVTSIEDWAFYGCININTIKSYIKNPFDIDWSVFLHVPTDATLYVPYGTKEKYMSTDGWKEFKNIIEMEKETTETIGDAHSLITYCCENALDYSSMEGVKAYIVTDFNGEKVTLSRIMQVPSGMGILLLVDNQGGLSYEVPIIDYQGTYTNLLKGVTSRTFIDAVEGNYTNFVLANGSQGLAFYSVQPEGGWLSAYRAYLQIPTSALSTSASKLEIVFEDEITGISEQIVLKDTDTYIDLQGVRHHGVPTNSGIYIMNGKKILVK